MGSGHRNIFVCFEYCASPLCLFDLLPSPKIEENYCGAPQPIAFPLRHLRRAESIPSGKVVGSGGGAWWRCTVGCCQGCVCPVPQALWEGLRTNRQAVGQGSQPPSHRDVLRSRPATARHGGSCGAHCHWGGPALPNCHRAHVVLPSRLGPASHGLRIRLGQWEGS